MTTAPAPERRSVLLVEDDDGVRRSTQLLLHGQGYRVRAHSVAAASLADPSAMTADYLVADYCLPDGDGIQLLRALHARGWTGRAVLMTGYSSPSLTAEAEATGYAVLLEKPLRTRELLVALGN
ncbi:Transcriptional regulatory protein FixJ [Sphingomonas sp. S2M10]|jgi:FixJ family two-component response regulator|uniref:response regulator n=1 Tax=Sphingomonas sp. S2M10 TaxID=2705010 RepID=UPI0014569C75|nr:response regulator [Sphingomonas sp. S2M10]NLS28810.1 Transcriptional regulatory protein FixJ [Sphingomonas sp. S2M10]